MIQHLLNALGAVGNVLDLPGSSVRDALALKNPFDQYLTPFSSDNRTSGRDLLRHHGLISSGNNWGNFAGGLAAETALDPLNLIGGSLIKNATTRQNQIARAHGLIKQLNPLEPGFSPEIIHGLTGRHVTPLAEGSQQAWQHALTPSQRSAIGEWTGNSTGPNSVARGGVEKDNVKYLFEPGGGYFNQPVGEKLQEEIFRDTLHKDQARYYDTGRNPPYTRENVAQYVNAPLREALATAEIPHDTELFRSHVRDANVGDIVHDPGFMATSAHRQQEGAHTNIFYDREPSPDRRLANIVVPKGAQGGDLKGMGGGFSKQEAEILFHKPHMRVLAKRELPVVSASGSSWYRGTGIGNYKPTLGRIDDRAKEILDGVRQGQIRQASQPNYLMEIVPAGYKPPLAERLPIRRMALGLAGHNAVARSRRLGE